MTEMTKEHYEQYHGPNRMGNYACHIFTPGWKPPWPDERWSDVFAAVARYDADESWGAMTRFYVAISYRGKPLFCNIMVPTRELDQYKDLYQMTLDKMVDQLDKYMEA